MTPKKAHRASHQRNSSNLRQISDYDTDTAALTDTGFSQPPPPPSRTNDELNLTVLRRHNPSIIRILSIAPYAVVYKFSAASSTWDKRGIEGTLFVVQLSSEELKYKHISPSDNRDVAIARFGVVVLNRRGLDNFEAELRCAEDVEVTEEYVILQVRNVFSERDEDDHEKSEQEQTPDIIGLWIFSEPPPSSTAQARVLNAQVIQECAKEAKISRRLVEEALEQAKQRQEAQSTNGHSRGVVREDPSPDDALDAPMARQLSLRQLFGQQRQDDDAWSVRGHNSPPIRRAQPFRPLPPDQIPPHPRLPLPDSQHYPNLLNPQNVAQQSAYHYPPGPVSPSLAASSPHGLIQQPQPRPAVKADTRFFANGRSQAPQDPLPPTSERFRPLQGSQQDMLLGLFQQARD